MSAGPPSTARPRSGRWVQVLAICLTLVVFAAVGVGGYRVYSFVHGFLTGSAGCLPSDFPRYPGAVLADQTFDWPGNVCHVVMASNDDVATVTEFYASKLNTGVWARPSANPDGQVNFQLANNPGPYGSVRIATGSPRPGQPASIRNGYTEITVELFDSTCLPPNFPIYPRAKFAGQTTDAISVIGCHVAFESADRVANALAFYGGRLSTGGWQVDSSTASEIGFRHMQGKRTIFYGTVDVAAGGDYTAIKIDVFS